MAYDFSLSSNVLANGRTAHYAKLNGTSDQKFLFAFRTMYDGNVGLYNTQISNVPIYNPVDYISAFGFWAYFIYDARTTIEKYNLLKINHKS